MKKHPCIQKSTFKKEEYVGYASGVQRIRRGGLGWETYALGSSAGVFIPATAETLYALGEMLDKAADTLPA